MIACQLSEFLLAMRVRKPERCFVEMRVHRHRLPEVRTLMVSPGNMSGLAARNSCFFTTAAVQYVQTPLLKGGQYLQRL